MQESPRRHIFLTFLLWFIIIVNIAGFIIQLSYLSNIEQVNLQIPKWVLITMTVMMLFNSIFAIALLRWKKWGFWGIVVSGMLSAILNIIFVSKTPVASILFPVLFIALLYWALNIGNENSAWKRLK